MERGNLHKEFLEITTLFFFGSRLTNQHSCGRQGKPNHTLGNPITLWQETRSLAGRKPNHALVGRRGCGGAVRGLLSSAEIIQRETVGSLALTLKTGRQKTSLVSSETLPGTSGPGQSFRPAACSRAGANRAAPPLGPRPHARQRRSLAPALTQVPLGWPRLFAGETISKAGGGAGPPRRKGKSEAEEVQAFWVIFTIYP